MVFSKLVDKTLFLYMDPADSTDFSEKRRKSSARSGTSVYQMSPIWILRKPWEVDSKDLTDK